MAKLLITECFFCILFKKSDLFPPVENWCPGDWGVLWINLGNFQELWVRVHPVLPVQRLREARAASPYGHLCSRRVCMLNPAASHLRRFLQQRRLTHTQPHPSKPTLAGLHAAVTLDAMQSQGLLNVVCQLYLRCGSVSSLVFSPLLWRECV